MFPRALVAFNPSPKPKKQPKTQNKKFPPHSHIHRRAHVLYMIFDSDYQFINIIPKKSSYFLRTKNLENPAEIAKPTIQIPVRCVDCGQFKDFKCKLGYKTNPRNRVCTQAVKNNRKKHRKTDLRFSTI